MTRKKKTGKKKDPQVHKDLSGLDIIVNKLGQIRTNIDISKINAFLNKNVKDKKLEEKKETEQKSKKKKANKSGKEPVMHTPIRVLIAKIGLDGHDRGAKVIATSLRDAGFEVVYTGLRQSPEAVVNIAIQEDVSVIGVSTLSGAHMTIFTKLIKLMKEQGMEDVVLIGGGIIPARDEKQLLEMGVGKIFQPGTPTSEIIMYIKQKTTPNAV